MVDAVALGILGKVVRKVPVEHVINDRHHGCNAPVDLVVLQILQYWELLEEVI